MPIPRIDSLEEWRRIVKSTHHLIILDCYTHWCAPCKVISPRIQELSETYHTTRFYECDVDACGDVADFYSVTALPSFIVIRDGHVLETIEGADYQAVKRACQTL